MHVNFAQALLKQQHNTISGLGSSLLLPSVKSPLPTPSLQIMHCRGNHWLVVSTIGCSAGAVKVYDSLYSSLDKATEGLICKVFAADAANIRIEQGPKQSGVKDCGLFAIATATLLAAGENPASIAFIQCDMRAHLLKCFEAFHLSPFPMQHTK